MQASAEAMEVRQLLAADLSVVLFDATLLDQHDGNSTATQYFAAFSSPIDANTAAAAVGAVSATPFPLIPNSFDFKFDTEMSFQEAANRLSSLDDFLYLQPEVLLDRSTRLIPNDPIFPLQWHLQNTGQSGGTPGTDVNITSVWDNYTGQGVVIAIVDDGVQFTHEDLASNELVGAHFDWVGNDTDPSPAVAFDWHGTAVAGVAAGKGNNGIGITGAAPDASLIGLRLLGANTPTNEAQALGWQPTVVDISNNSWGPADNGILAGMPPQVVAALQAGATLGRDGNGIIYVWAGGNGRQNNDNVNYDAYASSRFTLAVAAIDHNGIQAPYSEPGAPLIVSAHSSGSVNGILTTDLMGENGYNATGNADGDPFPNINYTSQFGGTSSSAPLVSGVVALMLEANPNLTYRDVTDILVRTARRNHAGDADWVQNGAGLWVNHKYGFGAVDAAAAVSAALTHQPLGAEIAISTPTIFPNLFIPDNNPVGISVPITTTAEINLEYVELVFNATHTWRGDLEVVLVSPSGTRSVMAQQRLNDSFNNYSNWVFTSARHWGEESQGTWTVEVRDLFASDVGVLNSLQLRMYGAEVPLTLEVSPATFYENAGVGAATGTVSRSSFDSMTDPIIVTLINPDPSEISIPNQVIIPAGQRSATFIIDAVDDNLLDGPQTVTILAQVGAFTASASVTVLDWETLTVDFGSNQVNENQGANATTLTITRSNTDIQLLNNIIVVSNELREYDADGNLVQTIPVDWPAGPRPAGEDARDIIVMENGHYAVFNGTLTPILSIYNPLTAVWNHLNVSGLSAIVADGGSGGVTSNGNIVFLADVSNGPGDPGGIVRVNTVNGNTIRFSTSNAYRDVSVGLDGVLYALEVSGTTVRRFDPVTLLQIGIPVSLSSAIRAIAVNSDGTIYGAGASGVVRVFTPNGQELQSATLGTDHFNDIELNVFGRILLSSATGEIVQTDTSLSSAELFQSAVDHAFVSFGEHPSLSTRDLLVTLTNSHPDRLVLPDYVVIPAGQQSVTIPVGTIDNNFRDGTVTVLVTAMADGYVPGTGNIDVLDFEAILVEIEEDSVLESAGPEASRVRIYRTDVDGPFDYVMTQTFHVTTPQTILDRDTIISTIVVPTQISRITDVNVTINLHHTWLADLDVYLVSPNGTRVELFTDIISNGTHMTNTVLDDEANISIVAGIAPFTGSFIPEELLSKLDGENPSGTWYLEVTDDNTSDVGTLFSWSLSIRTAGLAPATVTLSSSDESEATVPSQAIIPANQSEVWVWLDAVDDTLLDGTQTVVISATSVNIPGLDLGSDTIDVLDVETFTFTVSSYTVSEAAGANALTGRITRLNTDIGSPLTVFLHSSDTTELTVPASVQIPAGQAFVEFGISAVDDDIFDGTQTVTITASAAGYPDQFVLIDVEDLEPSLLLTAPLQTVGENFGILSVTVTRLDQSDISLPMVVTLFSSDLNTLTVPPTVVIPANQVFATFNVNVIDNTILQNTRTATISATSPGLGDGELTITVTDHETLTLTLTRYSFLENAGSGAAVATLTRSNTNNSLPLVVTLTSSDLTEVTLPATVTIPAGQSSITFNVTAVNDNEIDGPQTVTLSAVADGYVAASVVVTVLDHEPPVVTGPVSPTPSPQPTITWNAIPGATRYEIWVNNISSGQGQIILRDDISAATPFYTPTDPLGIGVYRVWVRAFDALEVPGFWSNAYNFTVNTAPVILTPSGNGGQAASAMPVLSWTAVGDAQFYDLWIDNATTGQSQVIRRSNLTTSSFVPPTGLTTGNYKMWVRAVNSKGEFGLWSNERRFTVLSTPTAVGPAGGTFNPNPTFTWNPVVGATHYDLWVSNTRTGTVALRNQFITGTSFTAPTDLPASSYTFWVRAFSNTTFSDWSVPRNFSVAMAPTITSPAANGPTGPTPQFIWSSVAGTARYELWVDRIVNGVSTRVIHQTTLTSTNYVQPTNLAAGSYRVWVRAISTMSTMTPWSTPVSFTVASVESTPSTVSPELNGNPLLFTSLNSTRRATSHTDTSGSVTESSRISESATMVAEPEAELHDAIMADWNNADWWMLSSRG